MGAGAAGQAILVVDDEPAVRAVAARILRRGGYPVLEAGGGEEALLLASAHEIGLLLTDTLMPGMSGVALADRLRQRKPALPVVYMSGYGAEILGAKGISVSDPDFLAKPFTAEALLARVRAALAIPEPPAPHQAQP